MSFIVAIDGPAGTGKGTVTEILSKKLKLINIDTGAIYRTVALAMIKNNISLDENDKINKLLKEIKIDLKNEQNKIIVLLNGEDVTTEIRNKEVTEFVSKVAKIKEVRLALSGLQRKMAEGKDVIMEGRDIGTYVFPNANIKFYLDADENERAKRRYKQNLEKGINMSYEEVLDSIKKRDEDDRNRDIGALKKADDAIVIDTTNLTIEDVVKQMEKAIKGRKNLLKKEKKIYSIRPETKWKKFVRGAVKGFLGTLYLITFRVKTIGKVPDEGSYIICANHVNYLDAAAVVIFNKRRVYFVGKHDLFRFRILNWLAHLFDVIPIKRNTQDVEAMKRCLKVIKTGNLLGIFPEGTRKGLEKNGKAKNGAAYMAIKTGTPIIPVGISGKFRPFSKIYINYGEPIDLKEYKSDDKKGIDEATKLIMDRIVMLTKNVN